MKKALKFFYISMMLAFFTYGLFGTVKNVVATPMMCFYGISTTQHGLTSTAQFAGGLVISIIITLFGERFNKIRMVGYSTVLLAVMSIVMFFVTSYEVFMIVIFVCGIATICMDSMVNALTPLLYPDKKNTYVPILHSSHSTGAMLGPLVMPYLMVLSQPGTFRNNYLIVGLVGVAAAVCTVTAGRMALKADHPVVQMKNAKKVHTLAIFKSKYAWLLLIISFCQYIFSLAINSWIKYYFETNSSFSFELSGIILTAFTAGALVMRFVLPLFLDRMRASTIFAICTIASGVFMIIALIIPAKSLVLISILCGISGFFNGVNGLVVHLIACEYFPTRMATACALPMVALNISGLVVPALMGALNNAIGLLIPMLASSVIIIVGGMVGLFGFKQVPVADLIEAGH